MRDVSEVIGQLRLAVQEAVKERGRTRDRKTGGFTGLVEEIGRSFAGGPHEADAQRLKGLLAGFDRLTTPQKEIVAMGAVAALDTLTVSAPSACTATTKPVGLGSELDRRMQFVKGVGPKRAELLLKLGIQTVGDALYHFPYRYEDRSDFRKIAKVSYGTYETVSGEVIGSEVVTTKRRRMKIFELAVRDSTGVMIGLWFNQPFMRSVFKTGDRVVLYGVPKPDQYGGRVVMEKPEFEVLSGEGDDTVHTGRIVPIYRATSGLPVRQIRQIMKGLVEEFADGLTEFLPAGLLRKYKIPELAEAVREVHFPEKEKDVSLLNERGSRAHKRLVFDEFLILQMGLALMKRGRVEDVRGISMKGDGSLVGRFTRGLSFALTPAQERVISEIHSDMASPVQMNRLVQGDVGSGKTVVALAAIIRAAEEGYQSAFMAPTEILAEQHFAGVKGPMEELGLGVALLTSSIGKRQREKVLAGIERGAVSLAVGTHSLIQDEVAFKRLGLAVTDEQHRFGVMQRSFLRDKGQNTDVLVMTATPIPRTLALTVYGDLDVSVIDSMPPGRTPVSTRLFDEANRAQVYRLVKRELDKGRQAYVVYPLVEESERSDLKAAKEGAAHLSEEVFHDLEVGLVHGRMKPSEKDAVMRRFRDGVVRVLVATTVVEVGVDVPNATVMVVEHAERFGLAQLHQLRGRVGRGVHRSLCLLVPSGYSETSRERLGAMLRYSSGFDIAEEDLRIRGPGEFFGRRQSGLPDLTLGSIIKDTRIMEAARKEAFGIIEADPSLSLPEHEALAARLKEKWKEKLGIVTVG